MLATNYVNGFGYGFGAAAKPTFAQYFKRLSQLGASRPTYVEYFRRMRGGLGAPASDFIAFNNNQAEPASFVGDPAEFGLGPAVFCNKEAGTNRSQCVLNKAGEAAKAPIRAMQRATDRLITLVNTQLRGQLEGDQLCALVPPEQNGGTPFTSCSRIGNIQDNPIASEGGGGIDGIVGDTTRGPVALAITFAGALKQIPNKNVAIAFINPLNNGILAEMSQDIANYLNDVADNFATLVAAFKSRGDVPITTQLDPGTIEALPFVKPAALEGGSNKKAIVGAAAMMIGLVSVAAYAAGKKSPAALYAEDYSKPAFGRSRRNRRSRGW